jgi:RimJ/RimL family protein N-acetyltransferase
MSENRFGVALPGWTPPLPPTGEVFAGRFVRLEPLQADSHAAELYDAYSGHDRLWDYMFTGPFHSAAGFFKWAKEAEAGLDPLFYALRDLDSGHVGGVAAFMRITPQMGVIEVGSICIAPRLAQSAAWTEAMFLMMDWAFRSGYRRYEWKCDSHNLASRRAAQRLGFSFEGIFRQHMVYKGRNRDTAWFSVVDSDWPSLREAFAAWLSPANFDAKGRQKERLSDLTKLVRAVSDPDL